MTSARSGFHTLINYFICQDLIELKHCVSIAQYATPKATQRLRACSLCVKGVLGQVCSKKRSHIDLRLKGAFQKKR